MYVDGYVVYGRVQVQRVSFELALPALMESITADSNHEQADFISDVDVMTVYLECMVSPHCQLVVSMSPEILFAAAGNQLAP